MTAGCSAEQAAGWTRVRDRLLPYLEGGLRARVAALSPESPEADTDWQLFDLAGYPWDGPRLCHELFKVSPADDNLYVVVGRQCREMPLTWDTPADEWRLGRV